MKFFRKNRKNSLKVGEVRGYLLYALGEIALVVIGILIALKVNNLNAESKIDAQIKTTLIAFEKDLNKNIQYAESMLQYNAYNDSLINLVLEKKATVEMYRKKQLKMLNTSYIPTKIIDENLKKLLQYEDHLSNDYENLLKELKDYKSDIEHEHYMTKMLGDYAVEQLKFVSNNYEWFSRLKNDYPEEAIDFFLNDPFYLNRLLTYQTLMNGNQTSGILLRRNQEILLLAIVEDLIYKENARTLEEILIEKGFKSGRLINCSNALPIDTSFRNFTAPILKNESNDAVSLNILDPISRSSIANISLQPSETYKYRLPDECIIEQTKNEQCIKRYKMNIKSYLIFE